MNDVLGNQTLRNLEMLRVSLLNEITYTENESALYERRQPLYINDYPVFQFCYRGSMPLYDKENKKYQFDIRNYYFHSTLSMYDFKNIHLRFKEATIIIQHYCFDKVKRDLDNRNRKYVIDAIRHTGLIEDDSYDILSIIEEAFYVEKDSDMNDPYINVFLLERKNIQDFYSHKAELSQPKLVANLFNKVNI